MGLKLNIKLEVTYERRKKGQGRSVSVFETKY